MTTCEACGREFTAKHRRYACPWCGFDNPPRDRRPRSRLALLAEMARDRKTQQQMERKLRDCFNPDSQ
jgi:hypothetical protein